MAAIDRDLAVSVGFFEPYQAPDDADHEVASEADQTLAGEPGQMYEIEADQTLDAMQVAELKRPATEAEEHDDTGHDAPQPLAAAVSAPFLARMERAFGQRFDHVRVHRDSAMPAGRQAFTRGHDVHLGPDSSAPNSPDGERILAHELAHVAQQARPTISWEPRPTIAALEADAHQASLQALAGQAAAVRLAAPTGLALNYTDDPDPVEARARRQAPQGGSRWRSAGREGRGSRAGAGCPTK